LQTGKKTNPHLVRDMIVTHLRYVQSSCAQSTTILYSVHVTDCRIQRCCCSNLTIAAVSPSYPDTMGPVS